MKRIKISLNPLFLTITGLMVLIFSTYSVECLKNLIQLGYTQNNMIGLIVSIIVLSYVIYLILIRYREVTIHNDKFVLKSLIGKRTIYFDDIKSIKQVTINLFNYRVGSLGLMGFISLSSVGGDTYNVSDIKNTIRLELSNNETLFISCDNPEELVRL